MKIEKIKAGDFFLLLLMLLQTPELSAGSNGNRIVNPNGPDARKNAFPWLVSIGVSIGRLCGGTLLNSKVVLSAAHCTFYTRYGPAIPPQKMTVYLGDHDTSRHEYGEQEASVSSYKNHPRYDNIYVNNDFSLLFLDRNIVFSKTISSACLPNPYKNYENTPVTAAGWGKDESGDSQNILQQVDLTTINNQECNYRLAHKAPLLLEKAPFQLPTKNMICADGHYKGICTGDSGGPLMVKGRENIVIGVTSWVPTKNCNENNPSVFARVSSQLEWIKANAGKICINQLK